MLRWCCWRSIARGLSTRLPAAGQQAASSRSAAGWTAAPSELFEHGGEAGLISRDSLLIQADLSLAAQHHRQGGGAGPELGWARREASGVGVGVGMGMGSVPIVGVGFGGRRDLERNPALARLVFKRQRIAA